METGIEVNKGIERLECKDKYRVLIVDDEMCILKTLSWIFETMEFETTLAGNGFDAFNKFLGEPFDLVITDLNMKGMDGFELIRKIKQRSPATPAVLITGEEPGFLKKREEENEADLIIFKPFKMKEIEDAVIKMMNIKKGHSSNIVYQ